MKDPSKPDPMPLDATMWLASCSKLIGTIAALQCVERGLLKLDDDVTPILSELKDFQILKGFETDSEGADKPIYVKNTKTITLRHLLTHSSGLGYDVFSMCSISKDLHITYNQCRSGFDAVPSIPGDYPKSINAGTPPRSLHVPVTLRPWRGLGV